VAAKALTVVNPWMSRTPERFATAITGAWSFWAASTRGDFVLRVIDRSVCWLRSSTMTPRAGWPVTAAGEPAGAARAAVGTVAVATIPADTTDASNTRFAVDGMDMLLGNDDREPDRPRGSERIAPWSIHVDMQMRKR
jgi:hypothetical protein